MKRKQNGIESLKSRYGRQFVLIWEIGLVLFVIVPLIMSIAYSFSDVSTEIWGIKMRFVGLKNYKDALFVDANYLDMMLASLSKLLYSVPAIFVVSLVIAILLNDEFKGRIIYRALYFFPVVIATGIVIKLVTRCTTASLTSSSGVESDAAMSMISVSDIFSQLGLNGKFATYFQLAINEIFNLVWNSGIQIVLFISGLQSIPDSLYEVSKVEGATKWEEFWFITIPMLGRVIMLVVIFTIVELVNDTRNSIMSYIYSLMATLQYGQTSAMLWIYFICAGAIVGLAMWLLFKLCISRWEGVNQH